MYDGLVINHVLSQINQSVLYTDTYSLEIIFYINNDNPEQKSMSSWCLHIYNKAERSTQGLLTPGRPGVFPL